MQRFDLRTGRAAGGTVKCSLTSKSVHSPSDGGVDAIEELALRLVDLEVCKFGLGPEGALSKIVLLTGNQTTGDSDDESDGLTRHHAWPVHARMALRMLSAPLPKEEIGVGARWHAWERVRVDDAWTRRHVRYELLGWTPRGARIAVVIDETAPPQTYTGYEERLEAARAQQTPHGELIPLTPRVDPDADAASGSAFAGSNGRLQVKTLHRASQKAEGELELDFEESLPVRARLAAKASYDVEEPPLREAGEVTRTVQVERLR